MSRKPTQDLDAEVTDTDVTTAGTDPSDTGPPDIDPLATEPGADARRNDPLPGDPLLVDPLRIDPLLDDPQTRIVVCCGSGGVGKTTTAAALGLRAAERGRKVVVLTIDPARRLAQSMGIDQLDNTPRQVPGVSGDGELHAMMLDMKRTFDEIVEAHADEERARAILENPFYQSLSAGFAGTQEYMAMEKLGQLRAQDEWDLIVVDTPPSRSALDFLDAPKRLGSFLDGKFIRVLMAPAKVGGRAGMKFLNFGMAGLSMMTGTLGKLVGGQLLRDVQTFVAAMDTMFGGFRTRADATYRLLQAPGTAFLVVAAPERDALREAAYFVERLAAEDMPFAGLVLNRVHRSGADQLSAERSLAAAENLVNGGIVDQEDGKAGLGSSFDPAGPTGTTGPPAGSPEDGSSAAGSPAETDDSAQHDHPAQPNGATPQNAPAQHADTHPTDTHVTDTQPSRKQAHEPAHAPAHEPTVEQLTVGLLRLHAERMRLLDRERRTRDRFTALHPEVAVAEVTALPGDVHDLEGLRTIGDRLAEGGRAGAA